MTERAEDRLAESGFLVGRRLADQAGLSLIALEQLGSIYGQQLQWFVEDQQASLNKLGQSMNPMSVWMDHIERRGQHIGRGVERFFTTVQEITERSTGLQRNLADAYATASQGSAHSNTSSGSVSTKSIMQRLRMDHQRLHRILLVMENLTDKIESLVPAELDILVCCVDYIAEYPDAVHHPLEDRVFARLLELELSEEARQNVVANAAKHEELTAATKRLLDDINAMLEDRSRPTEELKRDTLEYLAMQRQHMVFEEKNVFRLAQDQLTAEGWHELESEDAEARDPLFDEHLSRFDALYNYVTGRL